MPGIAYSVLEINYYFGSKSTVNPYVRFTLDHIWSLSKQVMLTTFIAKTSDRQKANRLCYVNKPKLYYVRKEFDSRILPII